MQILAASEAEISIEVRRSCKENIAKTSRILATKVSRKDGGRGTIIIG